MKNPIACAHATFGMAACSNPACAQPGVYVRCCVDCGWCGACLKRAAPPVKDLAPILRDPETGTAHGFGGLS